MELGLALKRVGAEIVKEQVTPAHATFYLRVDPSEGEKWVSAITNFMVSATGKPFKIDMSKYFFVSQGAIRYLWRLQLSGEVDNATSLFRSSCIQASMAHAPEVTSIPLVGRARYPFNPALGQLKGGHGLDQAQSYLGMAIMGGGLPS